MRVNRALLAVLGLCLLAGGIWLDAQRRAIADLEERNGLLRQHLVRQHSAAPSQAKQRVIETPLDRNPIDWVELARQLRSGTSAGHLRGFPYLLNTNQRLENQILALTREELIAALDAIEAEDLSKDDRALLTQRLVAALIDLDPHYVLGRLIDRLHHEQAWQYRLTRALSKWALQEPAQATDWLDEQVAAGALRSLHLKFETALISSLAIGGGVAAAERMLTLPADKRLRLLWGFEFGQDWGEEELMKLRQIDPVAVFAKLARTLPEPDRFEALAWILTETGETDRSGAVQEVQRSLREMATRSPGSLPVAAVSDLLSRIDATEAEREACLLAVAKADKLLPRRQEGGPNTAAQLPAMRDWLRSEAPDLVERVTARALEARFGDRKEDYAEWAALALQYHQHSGDDELLLPLLRQDRRSAAPDLARTIAETLADETLRAEHLEELK